MDVEIDAPPVSISVGSEAPVDTSAVTLTHVGPATVPPGVSVTPDGSGLKVAASLSAVPQAVAVTIDAIGCTATACDQTILVRLPLTVKPLAAPPVYLDDFTSASPDRPGDPVDDLPGVKMLTDELLMTLGTPEAPGSRATADAAAAANAGVVSAGIDDLGVYEVRWTSPQDLEARRAGLLAQPGVSAVSYSTLGGAGAHEVPSDWSDDGEQATWPFTQMHAQEAWDVTHGSDVTVGIVDEGVPFSDHEDLNVVDSARDPVMGHATHVAGLACGRQNGIGLVGMAWGCPIVAIAGGTDAKKWLVAAQAIAKKPGVRVVNMSLGYFPSGGGCGDSGFTAAAEKRAKDLKPTFRQLFEGDGRAIVWTLSAGNNCVVGASSPMGMNSGLRNVITVAATNSDRKLAVFSNYGEGVEVAAPGGVSVGDIGDGSVGIWSTWIKTCGLFGQSTCGTYAAQHTGSNGIEPISGTSMAAPLVAGIAALIRSKHPGYGAVETADCITDTAGDVVGTVPSRSNLPTGYSPVGSYPANSLKIVNAEAAVACRTVDSTDKSLYLGDWSSAWPITIAEESPDVLGIINHASTVYPNCTWPPELKIFTGLVLQASGEWTGSVAASNCSTISYSPTAVMRAVRGYNGKLAIVLAWSQTFGGPRPSIDADGVITSSGAYYATVASRASARPTAGKVAASRPTVPILLNGSVLASGPSAAPQPPVAP